MKYVLCAVLTFIALACSGCGVSQSSSTVTQTVTPTLMTLPSATATEAPVNPEHESGELVSTDPTATPFVHTVKEGDTLLSIALLYGVGLEELVLVNPGIDPRFLSVGQALRIPGPEGEAVDVLLPTPTPVPLINSSVRCFEAITGELRCIATILNELPQAVEAVSGIIGLYNQQGELIDQKASDGALRFLPAGKSMPLSVIFADKPDDFSQARIQILSAIQDDPDVSRFVPIEIEEVQWAVLEGETGATVSAQISLPEDLARGTYLLRVLGMVRDANHEVAGFRLIEQVINTDVSGPIAVQFMILSLGPQVKDGELVAELSSLD